MQDTIWYARTHTDSDIVIFKLPHFLNTNSEANKILFNIYFVTTIYFLFITFLTFFFLPSYSWLFAD